MKKLFINAFTVFIKNKSKRKLIRRILNNKLKYNHVIESTSLSQESGDALSQNHLLSQESSDALSQSPLLSQESSDVLSQSPLLSQESSDVLSQSPPLSQESSDALSQSPLLSQQNISLKDLYFTIHYAVETQLSIQNLHQKTFSNFENKHTNQDIVLVGTGPTASKYTSKNFIQNALHIGVNKAYILPNIKLDYFFMEDVHFLKEQTPEELQMLYESNYIKFFGLVEDCKRPNNLTLLAKNSFSYKTDNYTANLVSKYQYYNPTYTLTDVGRFTSDLKNQALGSFGSVIFPAIQFALYTNPKRIYLVGCDCTDNGNFYQERKTHNYTTLFKSGWEKLKEFASKNYPQIEIISINPEGLKGLFNKDIYTD